MNRDLESEGSNSEGNGSQWNKLPISRRQVLHGILGMGALGTGMATGVGQTLGLGDNATVLENERGVITTNNQLLQEDFENYSVGSFPNRWSRSGNNDQQVVNSPTAKGDQALEMIGSYGGCWQALAHSEFVNEIPSDQTLVFSGYMRPTGTGDSGCHGNKNGNLVLQDSPSSAAGRDYMRKLIQFRADGTVAGSGLDLGSCQVGEYNSFEITYQWTSSAETVDISYTINGESRGTTTVEATTDDSGTVVEPDLIYLTIISGDYKLFVDGLSVSLTEAEESEITLDMTGDEVNPGKTAQMAFALENTGNATLGDNESWYVRYTLRNTNETLPDNWVPYEGDLSDGFIDQTTWTANNPLEPNDSEEFEHSIEIPNDATPDSYEFVGRVSTTADDSTLATANAIIKVSEDDVPASDTYETARTAKLEEANYIDTISVTSLNDSKDAEEALSEYDAAYSDGEFQAEEDLIQAAQTLRFGEQIQSELLTQIGESGNEALGDSKLAVQTMRYTIEAAVELLLSAITLDTVNAGTDIGGNIAKNAAEQAFDGAKEIIHLAFSSALESDIHRNLVTTANEAVNRVLNGDMNSHTELESYLGESVTSTLANVSLQREIESASYSPFNISSNPYSGMANQLLSVEDTLNHVHDVLSADNVTPDGLDGSHEARLDTLFAAEDTIQKVSSGVASVLDAFDSVLSEVNLVTNLYEILTALADKGEDLEWTDIAGAIGGVIPGAGLVVAAFRAGGSYVGETAMNVLVTLSVYGSLAVVDGLPDAVPSPDEFLPEIDNVLNQIENATSTWGEV